VASTSGQIPSDCPAWLRTMLERLSGAPLGSGFLGASAGKNFKVTEKTFPSNANPVSIMTQFNGVDIAGVTSTGKDVKNCHALYVSSSGTVVPNNTTTVVNFNSKQSDTDNAVTIGAAWLFTCQKGKAGTYSVSSHVLYTGVASGFASTCFMELVKNSSIVYRLSTISVPASGSVANNGFISLRLEEKDNIFIRVNQNSGASMTTAINSTNISIQRINGS
jgi:hypothetical protein